MTDVNGYAPKPTMEKNKRRADGVPVGHEMRMFWYRTSDTGRDVIHGYECVHCLNRTGNGTADMASACPAFRCSQCYFWHESPINRVVLPGAERSAWFCLPCLRAISDRCASEMGRLISEAQGV